MDAEPEAVTDRVASGARTVAWACVLGLVAVVPLLTTNPTIIGIGRLPLTVDQVDLPRSIAIVMLAWLGMVAWGLAEWRHPAGVRWSRVWWVLLVFMLLATVSAALSPYPRVAYLGKWFSYEGLLMLWTYGVAAFVAAQTIAKARLVTLVRAVSVTGAVLALYGILQSLGLDQANWLTVSWWGDRAFATWANPDFFGGYLLFPLASSIALLTGEANRRWRAVGALSLALVGGALVLTLTRGAWLAGLLTATLMLGCLLRRGLPWKRAVAVALLVFVVAVVVGYVVTDGMVFTRVVNAFKSGDDGVGGRIDIWRSTVPAVMDRPVTGSGPDTYELAMMQRLSAEMPRLPDDPHNIVLYLLMTLGLPATVVALGFGATVLIRGARLALLTRDVDLSSLPLAAVWSAAVAHGAVLMLSPSITASTAMLFVFLGILIATGSSRAATSRVWPAVAVVVAVVALIGSAWLSALGLAADHAYLNARTAAREGQGDRIGWATKAVELNPLNDTYAVELLNARSGE